MTPDRRAAHHHGHDPIALWPGLRSASTARRRAVRRVHLPDASGDSPAGTRLLPQVRWHSSRCRPLPLTREEWTPDASRDRASGTGYVSHLRDGPGAPLVAVDEGPTPSWWLTGDCGPASLDDPAAVLVMGDMVPGDRCAIAFLLGSSRASSCSHARRPVGRLALHPARGCPSSTTAQRIHAYRAGDTRLRLQRGGHRSQDVSRLAPFYGGQWACT
jgi:hypothetical protein